jgi:hypothetical protein
MRGEIVFATPRGQSRLARVPMNLAPSERGKFG